ncbi:MAG: hypothetical protein UU16_C0044G0010 [Candidatus Woesebacteria bacterium GW2011_GWA2_40_7]|uniref:Ribbon-helix-helix protein CopG domain-containing protein n=3 Tax=Candidatus Woeseibacteriota TaxID=1752722 RepID=A0A0G0UU87_9BACT|nr:MAG: hypothetical protein UT17_C0001G0087 [Candidatus Woesebacteria bacterium GW2011_GWB1_39_10]KKR72212.1 MAG: hypothetical protein UU16_C0044G0010 [Candidatus Woesebacteria bacterium GW2011_GWA2_40_7]KKR92273.1 MAG: hypothetical protein UU42_C0002G0087 [Candidatus Woesebacteria bacterium GW2011_GWA1_41_13b]
MVRTQVYIPDEQYSELQLMVAMGAGTFSELIREGINEIIKKKRKVKNIKKFDPWKDFVGKGPRGGPKDLSSNLDYYLYVEPYLNKKK